MDGITWAASAMEAAQKRLEIATQNLANGSTDGFERLTARGSLTPNGVRITALADAEQGPLRHTGRPDDRAIAGGGYFILRDARGNTLHTRSGAFERDRFGHLCDSSGRRLIGTFLARGASVRSGFLEASNVNAIGEMIDVLTAQRSYETAQQAVAAIDRTHQKAASDAARVQ